MLCLFLLVVSFPNFANNGPKKELSERKSLLGNGCCSARLRAWVPVFPGRSGISACRAFLQQQWVCDLLLSGRREPGLPLTYVGAI